jgi:hypothetical protein
MTRKLSTLAAVVDTDEPLTIADELDAVKRMVWALASACDGISSREPAVEGIAYLAGLIVDRLEALEQRVQQEPTRAA